MTFKFKSQATADLLMLQVHAQQLLELIGKDASGSGILEPADMPAALRVLKDLPASGLQPDDATSDLADPNDETAADDEQPAAGNQVSLRQRAWPFIQMIERSLAADKPIVWGV
ncbi:MAG: DUF1840 domain-containing protein [Rubrivivax sp.]|nr:MAG: DUF1840 domain-containing protein [Rubrivivax sp.]